MSAPGTVSGSLSVTILGLTHSWVGDLTAQLTHVGSGTTQWLFFRIGNPEGDCCGDSSDFGGDYTFADGGADIWAAAAALPGGSIIPPGTYSATGPASSAALPLSAVFNGLPAAGIWRLTISDVQGADQGSFSGWTLAMNVEGSGVVIPEPGTAALLGMPALFFLWYSRRAELCRRQS